jgi:hypothetical protein
MLAWAKQRFDGRRRRRFSRPDIISDRDSANPPLKKNFRFEPKLQAVRTIGDALSRMQNHGAAAVLKVSSRAQMNFRTAGVVRNGDEVKRAGAAFILKFRVSESTNKQCSAMKERCFSNAERANAHAPTSGAQA